MIAGMLYTWIDVQAALQAVIAEWPDFLFSARAYWDAVTIEHQTGRDPQLAAWLAERFGPRWIGDGEFPRIRLESRPDAPGRFLPVHFEAVEGPAPVATTRRTFRQPDTVLRRTPAKPPVEELSPKIFAWHSFKGGVGRTTTALQFARLLARRPRTSVMLVDMDFEAPGITWMTAASRLPVPPIAMSDVLALIHSTPPADIPEALRLIEHRLRDSLVDDLVILPALRGGQREPDVRPEHLEAAGANPLADILSHVARAVGVTHVIVDLRAGRSELSASLLLDRRVARVLVTTCAGQSVRGTQEMLQDLSGAFPEAETDPPITVLVSKLPSPPRGAFESVKAALASTVESIESPSDEEAAPVRFTAALHDENLLALPLEWSDVIARLDVASVLEVPEISADLSWAQWAAEVAPGEPALVRGVADGTIDDRRRALAEFAEPLVIAEASSGGSYHDAEFLRTLIQSHRTRLPLVVVVGDKGTGKTFTFLRLVVHETWRGFAEASKYPADITGRVVPIVWPKSLQERARAAIDKSLGGPGRASAAAVELQEALDSALKSDRATLTEWRTWWIEQLHRRAGARAEATADPALFVIDGLEELLPDLHQNDRAQRCLRALLQDVPAALQGSGASDGLIIFTRSDYVRAAVQQNAEQFLAQYRRYQLWWDRREALRLVAWIAVQAKVVAADLDATETLRTLWGRKMGSDASRASISDVWVLEAMSTRKQEDLRARDLVRLVATAAKLSIGRSWADRLLTPHAIREALDTVGRKKIEDVFEESAELGKALERFRTLAKTISIPFIPSELENKEDRLALGQLEDAEIAWREGDEIWFVPLYRRGLGMRLQPRRRERVRR